MAQRNQDLRLGKLDEGFMSSVNQLAKIIDRNEAERQAAKLKRERETARQSEIDNAPDSKVMGFLCPSCRLDFDGPGWKTVRHWPTLRAIYQTKCPDCGKCCIRRITDTHNDPYFMDSPRLKLMRAEAGNDVLQPGDPNFERVWGWRIRKRESDRLAAEEEANWTKP